MTSNKQTDFFNVVSERHAVRHFDASLTLSEREIRDLLAIANSAPSSWNLQHWKFLLITDPAAKQKLLPIAYGQKQVIEASFVVAIPGDLQANLNAETIYESDVQAGILPESVKTKMIEQVETAYATEPNTARDEAIRNASLAAMQLMLAAKARGLDSCPMGGYDAGQFIKAFNVPFRYLPVMLVAVGRAARPAYPSRRLPVDQKIVWNRF